MRGATSYLAAGGAVLAAAAIGSRFGPQRSVRTAIWYRLLRKPSFTPPGAAIGAVWSVLDVLLGVTGARLLAAPPGPDRSMALAAWGLNVAGLAGFPWVFFGREQPAEGLAVTTAMLGATSAQVAAAARVDRVAALAGIPLMLWLGFAGTLAEEIWRHNRGRRVT